MLKQPIWLLKFRFNIKERKEFYRFLSGYLDSNKTLPEALQELYDLAVDTKDFKQAIYKNILESMLGEGKTVSQALSVWIPKNELMLIDAGNKNSRLSDSFKEAVYLSEAITDIRNTIVGNLFMPFLMLLVIFGMLVGFRLQLMDKYLELMPDLDAWPDNSLIIYHISDFLWRNWLVILVGFILTTWLVIWSMDKFNNKARYYLDKLPPYSIYKGLTQSSFLITFSSLLKAKVPMNEILEGMRDNASIYLKYFINKMIYNLSRGSKGKSGRALNVGLLEYRLAKMIESISELPTFEDSLYRIGRENIEETKIFVLKTLKTINMVLVLTILGFAMYMYFTVYELNSAVVEYLKYN